LRPDTLFGDKFESYLNEKPNIPLSKRTGRQPIVEVKTDWSAPEHQAKIMTDEEMNKAKERLAKLRARRHEVN